MAEEGQAGAAPAVERAGQGPRSSHKKRSARVLGGGARRRGSRAEHVDQLEKLHGIFCHLIFELVREELTSGPPPVMEGKCTAREGARRSLVYRKKKRPNRVAREGSCRWCSVNGEEA